jgi:hypothetical protein
MTERFVKELEIPLTAEERAERGEMLASTILELFQLDVKAKESAGQFSAAKKKLEKKRYELATAVDTGRERRPVPCEERANERLFRVETVRLDTEEIVDVRAMSDEELSDAQQGKLFNARAAASNGDDGEGPADTGTLPNHPTLETTRAPDGRVACPGPAGDNGEPPAGCYGEDCPRCLGIGFVPSDSVADAEAEPGTEIDDPAAVLAGDADPEAPEAPATKGRKKKDARTPAAAH